MKRINFFIICLLRHGGFGLKFGRLLGACSNEYRSRFVIGRVLLGATIGQNFVVLVDAEYN